MAVILPVGEGRQGELSKKNGLLREGVWVL